MFEVITTTPSVLRWARETSGRTEEDVIKHLHEKRVSISILRQWESGKAQPAYSQLKKLARFYGRPIAIFFLPKPPPEESAQEKLRAVPTGNAKSLSPKMLQLVRKAQLRQINLYEIYGEAPPNDFQNFKRGIGDVSRRKINELAAQVREALGVPLEEQFRWKNIDVAFTKWRNKLEGIGIWVFKEAFGEKNYAGFCLYDEHIPVIYVSTNAGKDKTTKETGKIAKQRQIFTLFHELGHLLIGKGGIDFRSNAATEFDGCYKEEEVFCNAFAGEFLVPDGSIDISGMPDYAKISSDANRYGVSREVILRKYLNKKLITPSVYDEKKEQWEQQWRNRENRDKEPSGKIGKKGGPGYYLIQRSNLGDKYLEAAFQQYYRQRIGEDQLADYLEVKVKSLPGIEGYMLKGSL